MTLLKALVCAAFLVVFDAPRGALAQDLPAPVAAPAPQPDREVQIAADAFVKDATLPAWVRPTPIPETKAVGPAVIALNETQILVDGPTTTYVHRAIRVNDASVLSSLGQVLLPFIPDYQHVVLHKLQVIRDGAVIDHLPSAKIRFLQRETGLEYNLYTGVVTASTLIDDLRVGDTLEIALSTIGRNPVFGPVFADYASWDLPQPTERRLVIVDMPVGRPVRWKAHGEVRPGIPAPTESIVGGMRTWTFEGTSLPALPPEASVPSDISVARWIEFSEYGDWNSVATWAQGLFATDESPSPERAAVVTQLRQKATVEERVVGALEIVQSQIRYVSVSLGTSSHRPASPNTVLMRRYGDCKDKSMLLAALLHDLGIDATPALARLGNRRGFEDRLPGPLAFDHVIVKVVLDGKPYYLDATRSAQHGRLDRMGQIHDGSEVLLASAAAKAPERIVVPNRDDLARDERTEKLSLPKLDGDAELGVVQVGNGVNAELVRMFRSALPQDRLDAAATAAMDKRYAGAKLIEPVRIEDDQQENRVTMTLRFSLPKPAKRLGNEWVVPYRPENMLQIFSIPNEADRHAPIAVRYPINVHYVFEAQFPDDVGATRDPSTTIVKDAAFTSTSEISFRGNQWLATADLRTLTDRIKPSQLTALRDDLQKLQRGIPGVAIVRDNDIKKRGFLGIGKQDLAGLIKSRQEDVVKRIGATIDGGKLSGSDLAQAYCDRGAAQHALGNDKAAADDAQKAVDVDPNAPDMLLCRGEMHLGAAEFGPAVDDLSRAIVLGAESGRAYYLRGQARFFQGRFGDAAADFAKASDVDRDEHSTIMHDVWRAMAYRRMDKPLPDDLQQRSVAAIGGEWPRPALAMLADRIEPGEIGAIASRQGGDSAQMNGTEADFYVGELFLARGDVAKAREAFTAARARGVIIYTEYTASGFELDRMGQPPH